MKTLLFADVNPNLIDGSTIWLQSLSRCLAGIEGVRVVVLLRETLRNDVVMRPVLESGATLRSVPEVLKRAADPRTGPEAALRAMRLLDEESPVSVFLVRGRDHIRLLAQDSGVAPRVWAYWLDRPDIVTRGGPLAMVARNCARLIVQSQIAASTIETVFGVPAYKILVLPPMVPDEAFSMARETRPARPCHLVYSGKLDATYNVEAFAALPRLFRVAGRQAEVHYVGDKFNWTPDDPGFRARMEALLDSGESVVWHRGVVRDEALRVMAQADFGLCWRSPAYDSSLEVSTKLLEFSALGVPPLLNRTTLHERLFGEEYPYFVGSLDDIVRAAAATERDSSAHEAVHRRIRAVARSHAFSAVRKVLETALRNSAGRPMAPALRGAPLKVVVASHENKFLEHALDRLQNDPRLSIRVDAWRGTRRNDPAVSESLLKWADVVFCEWCAGPAVWYSKRIGAGQRCYVRLHRFELFENYPREVAFENVDLLVTVSPWLADQCAERFGWPREKIVVRPQYVDFDSLNRRKHPWAERTVGMVGINGFFHKRPDRAFDVVERLAARNPVWRLRVRSAMPWDIDWLWERDAERQAFRQLFSRIMTNPGLRDRVLFDTSGPDMAEWYRSVSYVLSPSDSEGCHTSVAEGMASGAIPILHAWPGAAGIYPAELVRDSGEAMADLILAIDANPARETQLRRELVELAKDFDVRHTVDMLSKMFLDAA